MDEKQNQQPEQELFPEEAPILPAEDQISPVMAELTFTDNPDSIPMDAIPAVSEEVSEEIPEESMDGSLSENAEEPFPSPASLGVPAPEEDILPEKNSEDDPFDLSILDDPELFAAVTSEPSVEESQDDAYQEKNTQDFEADFQAPPQPKPRNTNVPPPAQKGRPKKKKGEGLFGIPNILVTVVWLALILVIGVTLGRMVWVCAADVLAFGQEDKAVTVTIYDADTMDDIVDKLYDAGLIRYKSLFNLYASISDAEEDIKPGIYDLNTRYDYHALVNFMSPSSSRQVVTLTIPEGYTCRQIFSLLEENRICTAVDLGAYAADGELSDYWFLENVERGSESALEGFLFPDTYEFYKNSTPKEALEKMLDNFNNRFNEDMRAQLETLNANVTGGNYTVREVTIVASLIEKESAAPAESAQIAGVIYNRLFRWEYPALLNIDAAIVYAQGGNAESIDTSLDSPYNTYLHTGLTPTPISNPGLSSLQAALNPASHDYYYYVLNPETGMHQFSATQSEHDAWVAAYYN